jgi:predicted O-linked N-acetylglucosamine transferase (SPINDLY family)
MSLLRAGRGMEAQWLLDAVLKRQPRNAEAQSAMAVVLATIDRPVEALPFAQRAADLRPGNHEFLTNLGHLLVLNSRSAAAIPVFERALALGPAFPARVGYANALTKLRRYDAAATQYAKALADNPADDTNHSNAILMALKSGRPDEAGRMAEQAAAKHSGSLRLAIAAAYVSNYLPASTSISILETHRRVGRILAHQVSPLAPAPTTSPDQSRPLKVGLLSPDLRRHAVASFVEPILAQRDPALEVICYATGPEEDEVSERLRSLASGWRRAAGVPDPTLAKQIRADGIDVLIETAGLTTGERLAVLQMRPAPLQITWCGYPATTGLDSVDLRIVDSQTDPPDAGPSMTERPLRLDPCFLCFTPPIAPAQAPLAAPDPTRPFTFASFNTLAKVDSRTLDLWARVLAAAPASRLLIKSLETGEPPVQERLRAALASRGVAPGRVEIRPPSDSIAEHLAAYNHADAALDTFPYHGTTTTCEALWMGVPVVTLAGTTHASRVGVSLLATAGQPLPVAHSDDDYVRLAADLAASGPRDAPSRQRLRDAIAASPLMDAPAYAARFWGAVRDAWLARPTG